MPESCGVYHACNKQHIYNSLDIHMTFAMQHLAPLMLSNLFRDMSSITYYLAELMVHIVQYSVSC